MDNYQTLINAPATGAPAAPQGMPQQPVLQTAQEPIRKPIGPEELLKFTQVLQKYKSGKARLERRVISAESWWKLRNAQEEEASTTGFRSASGWLHNVLVSKHADAMEAFPEPNILPREPGDRSEAAILSKIIPCIMEQNQFERTYSDAMWQKVKTGTGCYKVLWDTGKLGGLGDISIERVSLLNLFWEPGITDIQQSRYFFHTELRDNDLLETQYPQLIGKLRTSPFTASKFLYDDTVPTDGKSTVVDVYYHKGGLLQYCKYVGDQVLYATENDTPGVGIYDHGLYPYVFDALFPIEGSPCGYGYVDLCRNPQTEIDLMKTAFLKNTMAGATPRYFHRQDSAVNTTQFLDLENTLVEVDGNLGEDALKIVQSNPLSGNYLGVLQATIQELRETSGNTETSTGSTGNGVTAASAIAALQEASGKGSRDSTMASYRAYSQLVSLCIELIRQFYDEPRKFRITGDMGQEQYVSYSNAGIQPQEIGVAGKSLGMRSPVFDIEVSAQKKSAYTKMSQNELALQFFQMGFFNPQITDQALLCLQMMDFDGKEGIMQQISRNGNMAQMLQAVGQYAMMLAGKYHDQQAAMQLQQMLTQAGGQQPQMPAADPAQQPQIQEASAQTGGLKRDEPAIVDKARDRARGASQPSGGGA